MSNQSQAGMTPARRGLLTVFLVASVLGGSLVGGVSLPAGRAAGENVTCAGDDPLTTSFPAFADEQAIVDGIDRAIRDRAPGSPMEGTGQFIVSVSRQYNVNPLWVVGSAWQESQLGTTGRAASRGNNNFFGIAKGDKYFSTPEEGLEYFIRTIRRNLDGEGSHVRYQYATNMLDYFMVHQTGGIYRPPSLQEQSPPPHTGQSMPIYDSAMGVYISWDTPYTPLNYHRGMISMINDVTGLSLPNAPALEGNSACAPVAPVPPEQPEQTVQPGDGHDPVGHFDNLVARGNGEIALAGWTVDRDTPTTSIPVHVYLKTPDGTRTFYELMADHSRPDVPQVHSEYGSNVGFEHVFDSLPAGPVTVEVYAIDSSDPKCEHADVCDHTHIGTKTVTVTSSQLDEHDPVGFFDDLVPRGDGEVAMWGWTVDPDTPTKSIPVHVYVERSDGVRTFHELTADHSRPDVPAEIPEYGSNVGFEQVFRGLPAGPVTVDVYAIDSSDPKCQLADVCDHTHLDTRTVNVTGPAAPPPPPPDAANPTGTFDHLEARGGGAVGLWGWTFDRDTPTAAIPVHLYITGSDGVRRPYELTANQSRPDVASAYPGVGDRHGYSTVISGLPRGSAKVDVYSIDSSGKADDHSTLGTLWVTVT